MPQVYKVLASDSQLRVAGFWATDWLHGVNDWSLVVEISDWRRVQPREKRDGKVDKARLPRRWCRAEDLRARAQLAWDFLLTKAAGDVASIVEIRSDDGDIGSTSHRSLRRLSIEEERRLVVIVFRNVVCVILGVESEFHRSLSPVVGGWCHAGGSG